MSDIQNLSRTFVLNIGGKEYIFSKFTLRMLADFSAEMKRRRWVRQSALLDGKIGPAEWLKLSADNESEDETQNLFNAEGLKLGLALSLKPNHPEMTEEAVGELINLDDMERIVRQLTGKIIEIPADAIDSKNAPTATAPTA